jgi:hypothetical protein
VLPTQIGARTISVCDVGDPVCDYDLVTSAGAAPTFTSELTGHGA